MAKVVIDRTSEYVNMLRNYQIYIDGKRVGTIANGKTREFDVLPGRHQLVAKIDWCSSAIMTFDVEEKTIRQFEVGGFKNSGWVLPAVIVITLVSYLLNRAYGYELLFYLVIPASLIFFYYVTIGRKKYLSLSEKM